MRNSRAAAAAVLALAAMGVVGSAEAHAFQVGAGEKVPTLFRGVARKPGGWHGFAGLGRGKPTPRRVKHSNGKHAKNRARRARKARRS